MGALRGSSRFEPGHKTTMSDLNTTHDSMIADRVVGQAERLEAADSPDDIEPLDVEYTVTSRGDVKEVTIVLTTGGPHLEADALSGTVRGYWGSDSHTTHVRSDALEALGERLARQFEEVYLA